jgi:hypothetical protein
MRGAIDEVGNRYGRLVVTSRASRPESDAYSTQAYWLCRCDCGADAVVPGARLRIGRIVSCGCRRAEQRKRIYKRLPVGEACTRRAIGMMQVSARQRSLPWSIEDADVRRLMSMDCTYCGAAPSNVSRHRNANGTFVYNGLDRVDSKQGYVLENVVPCCHTCNKAKSNLPLADFRAWVKRVAERFAAQTDEE